MISKLPSVSTRFKTNINRQIDSTLDIQASSIRSLYFGEANVPYLGRFPISQVPLAFRFFNTVIQPIVQGGPQIRFKRLEDIVFATEGAFDFLAYERHFDHFRNMNLLPFIKLVDFWPPCNIFHVHSFHRLIQN